MTSLGLFEGIVWKELFETIVLKALFYLLDNLLSAIRIHSMETGTRRLSILRGKFLVFALHSRAMSAWCTLPGEPRTVAMFLRDNVRGLAGIT